MWFERVQRHEGLYPHNPIIPSMVRLIIRTAEWQYQLLASQLQEMPPDASRYASYSQHTDLKGGGPPRWKSYMTLHILYYLIVGRILVYEVMQDLHHQQHVPYYPQQDPKRRHKHKDPTNHGFWYPPYTGP